MKTKTLCISGILAALFCAHAANAAVIMTLEQVGPDVVATGSGTVDLADLSYLRSYYTGAAIGPFVGLLSEGNGGTIDLYLGISGPTNFGGGSYTFPSTGTGDPLGIYEVVGDILVPSGYVSGSPLSSTATWDNTDLAALGVTPGIYTWTWGSGANADSLTLYAGVPVPTPEPASALLLTLGAALLALCTWLRTRRCDTLESSPRNKFADEIVAPHPRRRIVMDRWRSNTRLAGRI